MDTSTNTVSNVSPIDLAIAAAKARKAAKAGGNVEGSPNDAAGAAVVALKTAKVKEVSTGRKNRITDEERARRVALLESERANRKSMKAEAKAAKDAEKLSTKSPAHMTKVEKAGANLPALGDLEYSSFKEITTHFTAAQITALALHLEHFNRVEATKRAADTKIEVGQAVRIVSGLAKYIGRTGVVVKAQRIRCYVQVEGVDKDLYCFTSDVEPLVSSAVAKTGTEA